MVIHEGSTIGEPLNRGLTLSQVKLNDNKEFKIDKKAFDRSFFEIFTEGLKLLRGLVLGSRFKSCGKLLRAGRGVTVLKKNADIEVGRKVQLHRGVKLSAWGNEGPTRLFIGDNTSIGDRTEIHAGNSVEIGSGCNISWDVCIMDRDYHKLDSPIEVIKPVKIEDNVWIGSNCLILKGITIGKGAVIAAGSVVTKDVPPGALAGGNPARIIKDQVSWSP